jgi:hypothetical protein
MSVILSDCCGPSHSTPATLSADTHLTAARKPCRSLKHSARARLGELHHNLDVIGLPLQGLPEVLRPLAPRYEARHPGAVRPGEDLASLVPVPFVGVDAAHDDVIFQGYALKAGQLTYDCRHSTMHGMPVTGGRGFRGLKPLWYNGVPP